MKVECPNCHNSFEVDEALKKQFAAEKESEIRDKYTKAYLELKNKLDDATSEKASIQKEMEKKIQEAESRAKEQIKAEAAQEAKIRFEQTIKDLNAKVLENSKETETLYKKLTEASLAQIEAEKRAQKKLLEETENIFKKAKAEAYEENRLKLEEKELQLKQTSDALKLATEKAERGSQQIQGEALEQLIERDLKSECRFDSIESIKSGARGADLRQVVMNNSGERCGVILWEIKNAKWQETWIEKLKEDMASEKAAVGIIVVQDLPEKFGELYNVTDRIFAIKPRAVKMLAVMLRIKIVEINDIHKSQKFSSQNIEAFYNYLSSGDFKSRIQNIMETHKRLKELHDKDKKATLKRWGEYEKQLDKMELGTYTFVGELTGISNGEIGEIALLGEPDDDNEIA